MQRRVVITGLGVVTSVGLTVEEFWRNLCAGRSGVSMIECFDTTEYDVKIASEVKNFDPSKWITKREQRRLDRFVQFAVASAAQAVEDAGLEFDKYDPSRVGVIVGSGIGGLHEIEAQHLTLLQRGPSRISPFMIPKLMANAAAGELSIRYKLQGPNASITTACASASNSIGEAFQVIRIGLADIMIAGGSEAAITEMGVGGFASMKALSTRNDEPERASRPFDGERDGFVIGEGSGIVVLEELELAKRRGAHIYAEIAGYGMSGDGSHITAPDPNGRGAILAMQAALRDAGVAIEEVDYINAHGTSTPLNDVVETRAIKGFFGEHARRLAVSSNKSMIGHLLGASGGVEMVATALTVESGIIPPTINQEVPDPECDLDYVPNEAREQKVRVALSNSFGFGGHNVALLVKRFDG